METQPSANRKLQARWVLANLAGASFGFAIFAMIGHGITGAHDEGSVTLVEIGAHALGLLVAGTIIAWSLRDALERHTEMASWFVPATSVTLTVAFLFGAYVLRPPFDFLLAYAGVGALVDLALSPAEKYEQREIVRRAALTSLLFILGSFVGMLALSLFARVFDLRVGEPGEDLIHHVITMVLGGFFIGTATGLFTQQRIVKLVGARKADD